MPRRRTVLAGTLAALLAGLGGAQLLPGAAPSARADGLVGFSGCAELLEHYRSELRRTATAYGFGPAAGPAAVEGAGDVALAGGAARSAAEATAVGGGPTGTNLQEQGVDEPDLAKLTDGRLVVLTGNQLRVLSADAQPRVLGTLRVGDAQSFGGELLLVDGRALVVLPGFRSQPVELDATSDTAGRSSLYLPGTPTTRLVLVDLSGDQPRELETASYDAQYVSTRLVDGTVRLVTTTRPQLPAAAYPQGGGPLAERQALSANQVTAAQTRLTDVLPQVTRSAADGTVLERGSAVTCRQTAHARSPRGASTLMVTTMRPAGTGLAASDRTAVTTDGDLVYASADRLYVATSRWGTVGPVPLADSAGDSRLTAPDEVSTEVHAFDTSSADGTRYVGSGSVPGYVLGRWALSHHDGALRVATTRQPPWDAERAGETSSMVVKLAERDGRLVETGRVEGLGRTEHIRAVRYFGDIAAVVTFRQTDPLYLLDLSGTPRVLGELKIPGFSTYLHPIGDGLLLGLGQDASRNGAVTGVQMSVFDITDLSRPTQVDRIHLGPGWTPALEESRAFTFDPDRRIATFAFNRYDPSAAMGQETSALGLAVDADGRIHEAGRMLLDPTYPPDRVLLDGDHVFAVSQGGVVAGDVATWQPTGSVEFPRG